MGPRASPQLCQKLHLRCFPVLFLFWALGSVFLGWQAPWGGQSPFPSLARRDIRGSPFQGWTFFKGLDLGFGTRVGDRLAHRFLAPLPELPFPELTHPRNSCCVLYLYHARDLSRAIYSL